MLYWKREYRRIKNAIPVLDEFRAEKISRLKSEIIGNILLFFIGSIIVTLYLFLGFFYYLDYNEISFGLYDIGNNTLVYMDFLIVFVPIGLWLYSAYSLKILKNDYDQNVMNKYYMKYFKVPSMKIAFFIIFLEFFIFFTYVFGYWENWGGEKCHINPFIWPIFLFNDFIFPSNISSTQLLVFTIINFIYWIFISIIATVITSIIMKFIMKIISRMYRIFH